MSFKKVVAFIALFLTVGSLTAATWPDKKPVYMISTNSAVSLQPIATTGDVISGTVIRGIPDGMGAFANGKGGITILSNHEVSTTDKIALRSASTSSNWGVSITQLNYSPSAKNITSAQPLIKNISYFNYKTGKYVDSPIGGEPAGAATGSFGFGISRFCSATYSPAGTFSFNGLGYDGALFTTGEEVGDSSRGFAFDMDGNGYQLPRMGMTSFENIIPNTKPGINTVALGNEDGSATDSQLHLYVGKKQSTGSAVDKAGLTNGDLYVLNIPTVATDNIFRTTIAKSTPVDATFKKIEWNTDVPSFAKGARDNGFTFARIEDGNWDPNNPNIYYFITTESNKDPVATKENPSEPGISRDGGGLWRLTFKDAQNPLEGAKLELLLNGGEAPYLSKPDNMTVTSDGVIVLQEDPGNNAHVARVVAYRIKDGKLATIATFDPQYFTASGSKYMTVDEESSGIIDVSSLLRKGNDKNSYFFLNAQIHTYSGVTSVDSSVKGALSPSRPDLIKRNTARRLALDNTTVEGGQYYTMTITNWDGIFTS
ncbi:MAG: alkaline phosphatase PhoX [Actinomycetes bacterium]